MNEELRNNLILHKVNTAVSMLTEIQSHIEKGFYNTAMNRMYYACYYAVSALLIKKEVADVKRHASVRNYFNLYFIKEGVFEKKWGAFYSEVMDCRAAADYEEFKIFTKEESENMYTMVESFIYMIKTYLGV